MRNLFRKKNKQNKLIVKSYRMISLLNYMRKLVEKVVLEEFSQFCKTYLKPYKSQIKT